MQRLFYSSLRVNQECACILVEGLGRLSLLTGACKAWSQMYSDTSLQRNRGVSEPIPQHRHFTAYRRMH